MKNFLKTILLAGMLFATFAHTACATPQATGNYSDMRLTPSTTPSAAVGNDQLLAESVPGVLTNSPGSNYPATIPATSWTTDLRMGLGDVYHGITSAEVDKSAFWTGTGATGVYTVGTIGSGNRIENTKNDYGMRTGLFVYQYVFHVTVYESYDGHRLPVRDMPMSYQSYQKP